MEMPVSPFWTHAGRWEEVEVDLRTVWAITRATSGSDETVLVGADHLRLELEQADYASLVDHWRAVRAAV